MQNSLIQDRATRESLKAIEEKLRRIESIRMLPQSATLEEVIDAINKITKSTKRA